MLAELPRWPDSASRIVQRVFIERGAGLTLGAPQAVAISSNVAKRNRFGGKPPLRERDRQAADEAFRAPIEFRMAAELRLDAGDHASGPEPARYRLLDARPPGLHPRDPEQVRLVLPAHR